MNIGGALLSPHLFINLFNPAGENINKPTAQRFLQLPFNLLSGQKLRCIRVGQDHTIKLRNQTRSMIAGQLRSKLMNEGIRFID
ncbi:hypothetical protein WLF10_01778 [Enterobacter cloacae]